MEHRLEREDHRELLVRFSGRGGIDGVFAMADNQATGAIQAVESAGLALGVDKKGVRWLLPATA
jgi:DNA-binding LacI/PurR family transcriptional regulator